MAISYQDSGVDITKGDLFIEKIKPMIQSTYNEQVYKGVGGFAALYQMDEERFLASATDGVGTKLKLAQQLDKHDTIGIDLVAMCANDLICTGARPLFFLDYLASGNLNLETNSNIIKGIVEGCKQSSMALIGGETAEMPGMYQDGEYDLAGFCVGEVYKDKLLTGETVKEGDSIVAIKSSGFHSNGYSLVRKVLEKESSNELKEILLTPTKIYVKEILSLLNKFSKNIKGIANITGSGIDNISRINKNFGYHISNPLLPNQLPNGMSEICERTGLKSEELHRTFNMGIGMVIITDRPNEVCQHLAELKPWFLGKVTLDNASQCYF